ncbi:peptide synthetase [Bordetella genomosp. 10]|uniref:Peptide synthetase n=1 Tax=Bordetella genomosp. 10 TaxID=1416804 RepID=A0A261SCC8_9BORD|nr:peptide synthetase [Bordetella genomosp. 10]OZI34731.1 peptide synthetase [Bordetella genomosp. 10]
MNPSLPHSLFDFEPYKAQREEILPLIKQFAGHTAFRSAVVEELELDEDFHRRPLRPEDLEFLKFQRAITAQTVSRLPSLATNRLLLSINELAVSRPTMKDTPQERERQRLFHSDLNNSLGMRIRPYLEHYGFSYVSQAAAARVNAGGNIEESVDALYTQELRFWTDVFKLLGQRGYLEEGLRFILIQRWSLRPSQGIALRRAAANGYFDALPTAVLPWDGGAWPLDATLRAAAMFAGVNRRQHSYWQFYLPTSMHRVNLLYALANRPDRPYVMVGAAYGAEIESLALVVALQHACPQVARMPGCSVIDERQVVADLKARLRNALAETEAHAPGDALGELRLGLEAVASVAERGRWDLGEQLRWLSALENYCAWAKDIDARIQRECPNIDRETFVEPREMCSTTHVHNDHRLVVIEHGDMIFWGNLGMQLKMTVGDMVLIPDGRLHGSTVVSHECTYHQPIIPDEWIQALLSNQVRQAAAA